MQSAMYPEHPRSASPRVLEQSVPRTFSSTPLQNSQVSSPITISSAQSSPRDVTSPTSSRGGSGLSYSPRSPPLTAPLSGSPAGFRKGDTLAPIRTNSKDDSPVETVSKSSPLATPRADGQRQLRNISAPVPNASGSSNISIPQSPSDAGTVRARPANLNVAGQRLAPRNSSMDSTFSSTSSATNQSQLSADPLSPNPAEIAQIIANAGSAEAAISLLIKERKQAATQNAQLFRLVQKQRSLIFGLNQDLEKAVKEREKYRKGVRDASEHMSPARGAKVDALRRNSPAGSSSTVSEDELPIQRHSVVEDEPKVSSAKSRADAPRADSDTIRTTLGNITQKRVIPRGGRIEDADEVESRRTTMTSTPIAPVAPLTINKRSDTTRSEEEMLAETNAPSPSSFAARRSFSHKNPQGISGAASGGQSPVDTQAISPSTRKGPPAPLNLSNAPSNPALSPKSPQEYGPEDHSESDYEPDEVDEVTGLHRGRKKTREDDDREREIIMQREQESRSLSKKQNSSLSAPKSDSANGRDSGHLDPAMHPLPKSPAVQGFAPVSPSAASLRSHLSPHASIAGMLSGTPSPSQSSVTEKTTTVSLPPLSPGLPLSPRPVDRPMGAPAPRQPREGYITSPPQSAGPSNSHFPPQQATSPRFPPPSTSPPSLPMSVSPPKSPPPQITAPPQSMRHLEQAPASPVAQPRSPLAPPKSPRKLSDPASTSSSSTIPSELKADGVFRGLVSDEYPKLLLPPNALPSIGIKVTSSRIKPSRHSLIMMSNGSHEDPVFTLGIVARSNSWQLWRTEKPILSLPQLDYELRQVVDLDVQLPDRSLFNGHAPAKIDARREALEAYFAALLDTEMTEKAALVMCHYLSTQVIPAEEPEPHPPADGGDTTTLPLDAEGKVYKEGYLTKRGKQFGGWKARFFVLEDSLLRYYDGPGGSLQGTIKLYKAQIGRQSSHTNNSPPRDAQNTDNQFRHAFLILEPKKKDANSHMRHVLCAESDEERDQWVYALLQFVTIPAEEGKPRGTSKRNDSTSKQSMKSVSKRPEDASSLNETSHVDSLQGVSYEETTPGAAPIYMDSLPQQREPASPMLPNGSYTNLHLNTAVAGPPTISGPTNGAVIQDAASWGNKPTDVVKKEKEQRKRSIWGFRDRFTDAGNTSNVSPASATPRTPQTARKDNRVFGVPLREAVEYCIAPGSNLCLPAVVYRCIEYLDAKNASNEEGIFRLSGSNVVIKQLKEKFDMEGDFDFLADDIYWDVHAVASLLKLYLRELPTTILTRELNPRFVDALDLEDKEERLRIYNSLVHKLPLPNWTLVRALSQYLLKIINNSQINKMSVRNVGIVFAPTLNVPAPVLSAFLTDYEAIFEAEPPASAVSINVQVFSPEELRPSTAQSASEINFNHRHEQPFAQPGGRQTPIQNGTMPAAPYLQSGQGRSTPVQQVQYSTMPHSSPRQPHSHEMGRSTHQGSPARQGSLPTQSILYNQPREAPTDRASIMGRPTYETNLSFEGYGGPPSRPTPPAQYAQPLSAQQQQPHPSFSYTRPSYETQVSFEPSRVPPPAGPPPPAPGGPPERPKYASGLGVTELMRDAKSRRRESSLLMMGGGHAKRKSSMPTMGNMPESLAE